VLFVAASSTAFSLSECPGAGLRTSGVPGLVSQQRFVALQEMFDNAAEFHSSPMLFVEQPDAKAHS
jgi:hypothetical protein